MGIVVGAAKERLECSRREAAAGSGSPGASQPVECLSESGADRLALGHSSRGRGRLIRGVGREGVGEIAVVGLARSHHEDQIPDRRARPAPPTRRALTASAGFGAGLRHMLSSITQPQLRGESSIA
jgi:hypothetical protein